jgi:ATP-dependent DNA ligase
MKYKVYRSQEFVIGGYTIGSPSDALFVGCYETGKLRPLSGRKPSRSAALSVGRRSK